MGVEFLPCPTRKSWRAGWRIDLTVVLTVLFFGLMATIPASAALADDDSDYFVFLPLVERSLPPGIHGRVTCWGEPAPGITVTLWHIGSKGGYVPFGHTQTQADGGYHFTALPELSDPYVAYHNGEYGNVDNPAYLAYWFGAALMKYTPGEIADGGDFDIADVRKLTPVAGATTTFPVTFTWEPRPATPQDDYEFEVYYQGDTYRMPWFYTSNLGYVGSYTWASPCCDFEYGQEYAWNVRIFWPDGSFGSSYAGRPVIFTRLLQ